MKYYINNNSNKTLLFFNKTDNSDLYDFLSGFKKEYYLGICMPKNNEIAEKIDQFQGAFFKKKLYFFMKNIDLKKDFKDGFYLDLVLLKDKVFYDYFFNFLFEDFFFENIFLINSTKLEYDFANINNLTDLENFLSNTINTITFGYTHRGEKILVINTIINNNNSLERIEEEQAKYILENTVIFPTVSTRF